MIERALDDLRATVLRSFNSVENYMTDGGLEVVRIATTVS
jgi:hypothetical protein